ncbi:hypothetical protein XELAEV_18027242mg [Xenopus laevis]|uniref:Uncharacterized protein n=1 Tax=Xenopus laevis TaxID=8355 RepID=A0A974CXB5_XENLA|nr:hypothetical protein XELAEV_18027242mg [Xenopus laevis]
MCLGFKLKGDAMLYYLPSLASNYGLLKLPNEAAINRFGWALLTMLTDYWSLNGAKIKKNPLQPKPAYSSVRKQWGVFYACKP